MSRVWVITGAGRGMGVDIAKAALSAGHKVVATGRNTEKLAEAIGKSPECEWRARSPFIPANVLSEVRRWTKRSLSDG